ncbi:MAG TPA: hypothetical protein DDY49_02370 [Paenibacillaceae bacterium]|nr:hypothetical protein [Paenibacillaceae bacterium]
MKRRPMKKGIPLALFDIATLGIPLYFYCLFKKPKKTIKLTLIIFPVIILLTCLLINLMGN